MPWAHQQIKGFAVRPCARTTAQVVSLLRLAEHGTALLDRAQPAAARNGRFLFRMQEAHAGSNGHVTCGGSDAANTECSLLKLGIFNKHIARLLKAVLYLLAGASSQQNVLPELSDRQSRLLERATMFEARLLQGALLKKVIEAIKDLVTDANFDCTENDFSLQAMDSSHVSLVSLRLEKDGFEHFRCDKPVSMGAFYRVALA